jgi:hypothetical protein
MKPISMLYKYEGGVRGTVNTRLHAPCETLAIASSRPNSEALAACMVLAHPRAAFHPCMCGLRRGAAAVATALIGYDDFKVVAETTTRRRRS